MSSLLISSLLMIYTTYNIISLDIYKTLDKNISFIKRVEEILKKIKEKSPLLQKIKNEPVTKFLFTKYVNEEDLKKYYTNNTYELTWQDINKEFSIMNNVLFEKNNKPKVYIRLLENVRENKYKNSFKNMIFRYLINHRIVKYIILYYCPCRLKELDIKKELYHENNIYIVEKRYKTFKDNFKITHTFKIRLFDYGGLLDLNWVQLGERIDKPKVKVNKRKK